MRIKDVPLAPAYLVFHDAFDGGAMDVFEKSSLQNAEEVAKTLNEFLERHGDDEGGHWKAYVKLPRCRVWKFHALAEKG